MESRLEGRGRTKKGASIHRGTAFSYFISPRVNCTDGFASRQNGRVPLAMQRSQLGETKRITAEKAWKSRSFVRGEQDTSPDRNLAQDKTRSIALKRKNNGCFVIHPSVRSLNPKPSSSLVCRTHHLRLRPPPPSPASLLATPSTVSSYCT